LLLGGGEGVNGSLGSLEISSTKSTPDELKGSVSSGTGASIGFGVGSPVEIMAVTTGTIIFDREVSGNSIQDIFSAVGYIRVRSVGSLIKYTRLDAFTDQSMSTQIFHSDMWGGGVVTMGASGSASVVSFK
jgi:hypothetical protein